MILNFANADWEKQAKELVVMSSEQDNGGDSKLAYMKMDPKGNNDFVDAKKAKEALQEYSKLQGVQHNSGFQLLASDNDIAEYKQKQAEEDEIYKKPNLKQIFESKINESKTAFSDICKNTKSEFTEKIQNEFQDLKSGMKDITEEIEKRNAKSVGLSDLLNEINDYNKGKGIIKDYKDKTGNIPESEYPVIKDFLKRCYDDMGKKKQRKWSKFNKNPWNFISGNWADEKTLKKWFDEIINKNH